MSQFTVFLLALVQGILHGTLQVDSMMVNPDPSIKT